MQSRGVESPSSSPQVYLAAVGDAPCRQAHRVAERLRDALPQLRMVVDAAGGGFRPKLKRADRSGATLALILGEDELGADMVQIKALRGDLQEQVSVDAAPGRITALLAPTPHDAAPVQ